MSALSAQRRIEVWRRCLGVCCICGQPMACPQQATGTVVMAYTDTNNEGGGEAITTNNGGIAEEGNGSVIAVMGIDSDGRLLTEEEPVRLTLMRFNALGDYQFAHVVDDYTFLEGRRNKATFRKEFAKHKALVLATNPVAMACFEATVFGTSDSRVYDAAVATNRRVTERLTIPSCRYCNKAMDREGAHVMATYRCFAATSDSDVPALEGNSKEAIAVKKVVQQIAFYFRAEPQPAPTALAKKGGGGTTTATTTATTSGGKPTTVTQEHGAAEQQQQPTAFTWSAKPEDQLLRDASMWRCIAHLWNWGRSASGGGLRFRMVAVFHASYYIYLNSSARDILAFETWHVHCWRPYYMARYAADSFLGLRQAEAGPLFDLSRKNGARWQEQVHARAMQVMDGMEVCYSERELEAIVRFEEATTAAAIQSEANLLRFFVKLEATKQRERQRRQWHPLPQWFASPVGGGTERAALTHWTAFFRYNLSGAAFQQGQCEVLIRELIKALHPPPTPAAAVRSNASYSKYFYY
jgi:hypothetical protein